MSSEQRVFTYDSLPVGFNPEAIPLGSLITNVHDPLENCLRPKPALDPSFVTQVESTNYSRLRKKSKAFSFSAFLSKIFTCGGASAYANQDSLVAKNLTVYQLSNYEQAFQTVVTQSSEAQTWLQTQVQMHRYLLLVVRVFVYSGATRSKQTSANKDGNASVTVPLTPVAGGTAAETVTGGLTDAGASVQASTGSSQSLTYTSDAPRVYGLSFRIVEASWTGSDEETPIPPDVADGATDDKNVGMKKSASQASSVTIPAKAEVVQSLFSLNLLKGAGRKTKEPKIRLTVRKEEASAKDLKSRNVQEHVF